MSKHSEKQPTRDPHRRASEYEDGYDWRTDPYYDEDAIRERMKADKARVLPVSVNDNKEPTNDTSGPGH